MALVYISHFQQVKQVTTSHSPFRSRKTNRQAYIFLSFWLEQGRVITPASFFRHLCSIEELFLHFLFHSQTRSDRKSLQMKRISWGPPSSPQLVFLLDWLVLCIISTEENISQKHKQTREQASYYQAVQDKCSSQGGTLSACVFVNKKQSSPAAIIHNTNSCHFLQAPEQRAAGKDKWTLHCRIKRGGGLSVLAVTFPHNAQIWEFFFPSSGDSSPRSLLKPCADTMGFI